MCICVKGLRSLRLTPEDLRHIRNRATLQLSRDPHSPPPLCPPDDPILPSSPLTPSASLVLCVCFALGVSLLLFWAPL